MGSTTNGRLDVQTFLYSMKAPYQTITHKEGMIVYAQGYAGGAVSYVQRGRVELPVLSRTPRAAVVAILGPKRRGFIDTVGGQIPFSDSFGRPAGPGARPPGPQSATLAERETILLVDDEASVRTTVGRMLQQCGYRVLLASVSSQACAMFDDHSDEIDLLLTDVVMPEMSGTALAQRLIGRQPGLPVLLMSGHMTTATFPAAQAHRTAFIQKPFRTPALTSAVRRLLDHHAGVA